MTIRNLDRLFRPQSVAVFGASAASGKLGNAVFRSVRDGGFRGPVFAVNPRGGSIDGAPVYLSTSDLPQVPDLAIIVTPAATVPALVSELGSAGCKAAVVISAGFEGEGEGRQRRAALLAAARPHLFRIVGPNCLGVMVPSIGLNASFARTPADSGRLALVAQSGAIASALLDWARPRGVGFSHVVTVGDMADVDFGDTLDYLAADESTDAILLYVEGVTNPRKFMSAARRAARLKPVLAVKGGRRAESAKVATSHTGALAGADAVYDAILSRAGIMRVDDLDDLFAAAELLAMSTPVVGERLAIVTNGGGLGVLAADKLLAEGGRLASLSADAVSRLDGCMPAGWSRGNPVDIVGDATEERYRDALQVVLEDGANDAVLVMYCPTSAADPLAVAKVISDAHRGARSSKALLAAWTGEASVSEARAMTERAKIATFSTPREAITGFTQLVRYRKLQDLLLEAPPPAEMIGATAVQDARAVIAQVSEEQWLPADTVKRVLGLYGIAANRTAKAATCADAQVIARGWGCRVALKVSSPDVVHKSDAGGVVLDVEPDQAETQAAQMLDTVRRRVPHARIDGILVEEMVKRPNAHEVFIGMTSDPTFGPVLAFGHGGTGIEVIDDKAFGLPPLNMKLAESMIAETRVGRLLGGYRNRPPADTKGIARALVALSQLVSDHPSISDIDINPLLVDDKGLIAVDARLKVNPAGRESRLVICPYPRNLERTIGTPHGSPFHVRPLQPQDAPLVQEFMRRLSPEDLRFRFFAALHEVGPRFAARLCQLDYDREIALIATPMSGGTDVMGLARFDADPDNIEAEFAIAVRTDSQNKGIGYGLMAYLKELAAARGVRRLWGLVMADNVKMLSLAKSLGMRCEPVNDDNTARVVWDLSSGEAHART